MPITPTGDVSINPANALVQVGITEDGSLVIDGGSNLILDDPDDSSAPLMLIGQGIGTSASVAIDGAGSSLSLLGATGQEALLGIGYGARSQLDVLGGLLDIKAAGTGKATLIVGAESDDFLDGTLDVRGGTLQLSGQNASMVVGAGASGLALLMDGTTASVMATGGGLAEVYVGKGDNGSLSVYGSSRLDIVSEGGAARLRVDNFVTIGDAGRIELRSTNSLVAIGNDSRDSDITVDSGGTLLVESTGSGQAKLTVGTTAANSHATLIVQGAGSLVDAGQSFTIGNNGLLLTRDQGIIFAEQGVIEAAGQLSTSGGTIAVGVLALEGSISAERGLNGDALEVFTILGSVEVSGANFTFSNYIQATVPFIRFSGENVYFGAGSSFFIEDGGYGFQSDDRLVLFERGVATQWTPQLWLQDGIFGQTLGQGMAARIEVVGEQIVFTAINDSDGSGSRILDYSDTADGLSFRYRLDDGQGSGFHTGKENEGLLARNVEAIIGSSGTDKIELLGAGDSLFVGSGAGNDFVTGSASADDIVGDDGSDWIYGGAGLDTLTGGSDADFFLYRSAVAADADLITDFELGNDRIILIEDGFNFTFSVDPAGTTLSGANFIANSTGEAGDSDDVIVYRTTDGTVFYDADGNGDGAAVKLTTVTPGLDLTAGDFLIVPSFL